MRLNNHGVRTISAPSLVFLFLLVSNLISGQPPSTQPLLIYNCAKMPSICRNVNQVNPLQAVVGNAAAGNIGQLDPGQNGGLDYITLTYDTSAGNKRRRRNAACPSGWKLTHGCPEANQPPTVASGTSWSFGSYIGLRWNPNNLVLGQAGYNVIANPGNTAPSGMMWTCDEWPPAIVTQGGQAARTYCAPQNGRCGGSQFGGTYSEQDIQGNIHSALRKRITNTYLATPPSGTYPFSFQTQWDDAATAVSAAVVWTNAGVQQNVQASYRRSLEQSSMFIDVVYENGTMASFARPMTEREIVEHIKHYERIKREMAANNVSAPAQQKFETLTQAPPLPITDITRSFIENLAHIPVKSYINQIVSIFHLGLPFSMSTSITQPPAPKATSGISSNTTLSSPNPLLRDRFRRQDDVGHCGPGNPCADGSCCNTSGGCGYGEANCGEGNCTSNCGATAACGRDSKSGEVSCPLDVCCSYYGYCGVGTDFCDSPQPDAPCQQGFGSCSTISAPSCGGSSALGRSIAYYQVGNNYGRECQRISPSQIDTTGLTHLNLAFASIDPTTFEVVPVDSRDVPYYTQFTALKSSNLQTWIAIGGWDFNDPGPTQYTFSQLASSANNRATFISSLQSFMSKYGFQGVDIDWEYPGAPDRSGDPADTENFVTLVKEMRASFGANYGISATLPASYWYLKWFDPIAMQPYVDFFGLMTYDLHGPWDKDVKDVGPVIIGQTNIPEIYNWTLPLWYDQVDPSKINLGLAYYGRGYTVENVDCMTVGCTWTGPSRPGPCTAFGGVMSLQEIENLISQIGVDPILDSTAMMKYLVWSDQWIGYDDLDTIAMKKTWANSHCFGGTMIWSIDLYSGSGSGDTPDGNSTCGSDPGSGGGQGGASEGGCGGLVYIDPSIWKEPNPMINCEPPCTFILPPLQLSTTTTITFPPYVTSLDVAWSTSTGWTHIIQTTTLTIPPVTTTLIPVWSYTVTGPVSGSASGTSVSSTFYPTSSILPPPFVIVDDPNPLSKPGVTNPPVTRTITPPPYPYSFTKPNPSEPTNFPVVTWKPGPPGPICKSGCGTPCVIFCHAPCLLNCEDGGGDFVDPVDPSPPPRPTPSKESDPLPTGKSDTDPPDAEGDDPEDEDEEDEDDLCAYEFNLPPPVYVDPDSGAGPGETISPAAPTPTPHPPPDPTPPSPNPATESLHCYNSGAQTDRGDMISAVNDFCDFYYGTVLDASQQNAQHTLNYYYDYSDPTGGSGLECATIGLCDVDITLSVTVTNGCRFTIDGPSPSDECGRIFRQAIDRCDTSSTQYKQGGIITSNCATWRIDPNIDG
ncbi:hypothetical protein F4821DRAFT_226439 [Hypoxylon rubiginosum]|uniref:Uncharacterized protein n=1 Tax=Hypoxylon rubiginosum TaxID=110542 RepID=A0ACC0DFS2_9PEZI|nr:hypothetical protein F4821DRAFT_226439 [Hypoxylon rubiginosum]